MQTNRDQLDRETLEGRIRRGILKDARIKGLKADWDDPATFTMTVPGATAQMASGAMQSTLAAYIARLQGAASSAPHRPPRWIALRTRKVSASQQTNPATDISYPLRKNIGRYCRQTIFALASVQERWKQ